MKEFISGAVAGLILGGLATAPSASGGQPGQSYNDCNTKFNRAHGGEKPAFANFCLKDPKTLSFYGEIQSDFMVRLTIALIDHPRIAVLHVKSHGGLLEPAVQGAKLLRRKKITVKAIGKCLSACVNVLAGGHRRLRAARTLIGVHSFKYKGKAPQHRAVEVDMEKWKRSFTELGIDERIFALAKATPHREMVYLTKRSALRYNLLTE